MSELLGVLPRAGGLLDQDSYTLFGLQFALVARAEKAKRDSERESKK
jgi:hypothetical protein